MKTTISTIIDTVERMREAQRSYFATHYMKALTRAKLLEGAVDKMLEDYHADQLSKAKQNDLFPETYPTFE